VVALPRVEGLRISGLPHDRDGFLPVDEHASVIGVDDVFAAGDGTDFPVSTELQALLR
jgi:sulfide:quinone oxidoreductase